MGQSPADSDSHVKNVKREIVCLASVYLHCLSLNCFTSTHNACTHHSLYIALGMVIISR